MKHQPLKPLYLSRNITIDDTREQTAPRQLPANIKQLKRVYRQLRDSNERPPRINWWKLAAAGAAFGILAAIESLPQAQALVQLPKAMPVIQVHDTDRGRSAKQPAAFSDDTITVTFHNCRENDKGHWSCQRIDGPDTTHYVYIPGLHPAHTRTNSLSSYPPAGSN